MSKTRIIKAEKRELSGKSTARSLRREGKIPAIIYGAGGKDIKISTNHKEFYKEYMKGNFQSKAYEVELGNEKIHVLPRDVQLDPVTDNPIHADFMRITDSTMVKVWVNVNFINSEQSPGLKRGGVLSVIRRDIELLCQASKIPQKLVVDLDGAQIGDSIHVSSITIPEGATPTITDRDFTIATIVGRKAEVAEDESVEEESEEDEADESSEETAESAE